MHPNPHDADRVGRHPMMAAVRRLLVVRITPDGARIINILAIFAGIPVAIVVCIPILIVTFVAGAVVGVLLGELGASEQVRALPGLVGFVGGLALCFLALVRIYRRLPAAIRVLIASEDLDDVPAPPILDRDPDSDAVTLEARIAAANAAIAAGTDPHERRDERG